MACWSRILGLTLLGLGLVITGCTASRDSLAQKIEPPPGMDQPTEPTSVRLQKSDPQPATQNGSSHLTHEAPEAEPLIQPVSAQDSPRPQPSGPGGTQREQVKVCAWVNGEPIFESEIMEVLYEARMHSLGMPKPERDKFLKKIHSDYLNSLIDRELMYHETMQMLKTRNPKAIKKLKEAAKEETDKEIREINARIRELNAKRNINDDEPFLAELRNRGMTLQDWYRSKERKFFADQYMHSIIIPIIQEETGIPKLREYYEQHRNVFQKIDKVEWQDLFIGVGGKHATLTDARRFAESLRERIQAGEDFVKLVMAYDEGDSHLRQGASLGLRPRGEINPPELEETLFKLQPGDVGPLVEMPTGFHIVRVTKREYAGQIPFNEEVQKEIRKRLTNEIANREAKRIVRDLRSRRVWSIEKN
jgi:hypothetical protein